LHDCLVDPLQFAEQLVRARNQAQHPGHRHAVLSRVLVFRGQPSPEFDPDAYARNQAQKSHWERDSRVQVTLRPLKYDIARNDVGQRVLRPDGTATVTGKREKGIDVLCAMALVREARREDTDLVILASDDSDLEPALDEALQLKAAKIETFSWYDPTQPWRRRQLRPAGGRRLWHTRLSEPQFQACTDPTDYSQDGPRRHTSPGGLKSE
ncbi:MAG TPA: hypothetical protein VFZ87_09785, partial [Gemmatimonadales bacterium]